MAAAYKINALGGLRVPILASDPSSPEDGAIWYNSTAGVIKKRENGATTVVGTPNAEDVVYNNATSGLTATDVQAAIDEVEGRLDTAESDISGNTSDISANTSDIADLRTTQGTADGAIDLGTFNGTTISDASTVKGALQSLETSLETKAADADVIKKDGSVALTGDQSMGGNKLTNLAAPTADADAATKAYVDAIKQGLDVKDSVRVASTADIDLGTGGLLTIDGVALDSGDRVLVKNQSTGSENGIYEAAVGAWSRSSDADADAEVTAGMFTFVAAGSTQADTGWVLTTNDPITVDTTALSFAQFSGAGQITAGDGLSKTGNQLDVNVDDSTIEIATDTLQVKDAGITDAKIATGIDAAKLADGSVSNAEYQYIGGLTSDAQTQLDAKLEAVSEDTTPSLGGNLTAGDNVLIHGSNGLRKGSSASDFFEEEYVHAATLTANTTAVASAFTFAHASFEGLMIEYKMKQATSNRVRVGRLMLATNGTDVDVVDTFSETGDAEITWTAAVNGANIELSYTNANATNAVTMRSVAKRIKV